MRIVVIFISLLLSSNLHAQWFQATATSTITNDDLDKARQQAIKKAVKDTLFFSGFSIINLKQLQHSKVVGKQVALSSGGEIKAIQIQDEKQQDELLTINIKVEIIPNPQQCIAHQFPKSIVVSRFAMNVPEQTVHGQIYNLHKETSRIFFNELSLNPYLLNIRGYIDAPLKLGEKYNNKNLTDSLRSLSVEKDSQYVVYGEINDLSVNFKTENAERYFYLTIYLYDAFQGHLIFSKQYREKANWQYEITEKVNTASKQFWETPYGKGIIETLDQANIDIAQSLQCLMPRARIIAVDGNKIQINLGRKNGLKRGTLMDLSYSSNFKDQFGIERSSFTISKQEMKVIQVHETSAVLSSVDDFPLTNIQIDDIAIIKPL